MREIRNFELVTGQEDDVILLGDLNVPPAKMNGLVTQAVCVH